MASVLWHFGRRSQLRKDVGLGAPDLLTHWQQVDVASSPTEERFDNI
jgi:hypothetical protein